MKLYGATPSPFFRKCVVVAEEKGIPYEIENLAPFPKTDELLSMHPMGKIPILRDGDTVVPDSSVICAYLERKQPSPPVYPEDPGEFARALFLEEYCDTKVVEGVGQVFFERFVKKNILKQEPDEEKVKEKLTVDVPPVFDYLDGEIGDRDAIVGTHFSIADIALTSPFVNFAIAGERVDAERWPQIAAYVERVHSLPCYAPIVAGDQPRR